MKFLRFDSAIFLLSNCLTTVLLPRKLTPSTIFPIVADSLSHLPLCQHNNHRGRIVASRCQNAANKWGNDSHDFLLLTRYAISKGISRSWLVFGARSIFFPPLCVDEDFFTFIVPFLGRLGAAYLGRRGAARRKSGPDHCLVVL